MSSSAVGHGPYVIEKVNTGTLSMAYRYALASLTGPQSTLGTEESMKQAQADLMRQWQSRCWHLRRAGWDFAAQDSNFTKLSLCPPVGVLTNRTKALCCQQRGICPFCWCRTYIRETFLRFEHSVYGQNLEYTEVETAAGEKQRKLPDVEPRQVDLVEISTKRWYAVDRYSLEDILGWTSEAKGLYVHHGIVGCEGAFVLCSIEPPDRKGLESSWMMHHRVLALQTPGSPAVSDATVPEEVEELHTERKVRRHLGVTRTTLVGALGRVCQYPRLLMRGSARRTLKILEARAGNRSVVDGVRRCKGGYRMSAYYGCVRGVKRSAK